MTFAPAPLVALGRFLTDHGVVNLGIVGDARHTTGYHLGRDRIYDGSGPGIGDADYSVRHPRDRAGLSNAAAAIDVGVGQGSLVELQAFSRWLVGRCQAGAPGSVDVREIIYSPDGLTVQRWDGVDGYVHTGPGNGDSSHTRHTHLDWFRDSQDRDKLALVRPYFQEADMLAVVTRQPFSAGISFLTRPGSRLVGYDPARPGRAIVDRTWTVASKAHAAATVSVSWPGTTSAPVPRGGPFLEVIDGVYAGLLIVAGLVDWIAPAADPGYDAGLAAAGLAVAGVARRAG